MRNESRRALLPAIALTLGVATVPSCGQPPVSSGSKGSGTTVVKMRAPDDVPPLQEGEPLSTTSSTIGQSDSTPQGDDASDLSNTGMNTSTTGMDATAPESGTMDSGTSGQMGGVMSTPTPTATQAAGGSSTASTAPTWAQVKPSVTSYCAVCHSTKDWALNEADFIKNKDLILNRIQRPDGATGYMPKDRRDAGWPAAKKLMEDFLNPPATSTGTTTGGTTTGGGGETTVANPVPLADRVAVFVGVGHAGRRLMSCDGGQSWAIDKSHDDAIRCWTGTNQVECDHNMFPGRGLAFGGDGYVYASHGWGQATTLVKSRNGIDWEPILRRNPDNDPLLKVDINPQYNNPVVKAHSTTFAGIAAPGGKILGGASSVPYSEDRGLVWKNGTNPGLDVGNYRDTFQIPWNGKDRVFFFGDTNGDANRKGGKYSDDGGITWSSVSGWANCTQGTMAFGNNVMLMFSSAGQCRSTDGGASWSNITQVGGGTQVVVYGNGKFIAYSGSTAWESTTGASGTWTQRSVTGGTFNKVAFHPSLNVYVAVKQSWGNYYTSQKMYRSTDGFAWTELASDKFRGGHPITYLGAGHVAKSTQCPGN